VWTDLIWSRPWSSQALTSTEMNLRISYNTGNRATISFSRTPIDRGYYSLEHCSRPIYEYSLLTLNATTFMRPLSQHVLKSTQIPASFIPQLSRTEITPTVHATRNNIPQIHLTLGRFKFSLIPTAHFYNLRYCLTNGRFPFGYLIGILNLF
jgi:hypothetical protein